MGDRCLKCGHEGMPDHRTSVCPECTIVNLFTDKLFGYIEMTDDVEWNRISLDEPHICPKCDDTVTTLYCRTEVMYPMKDWDLYCERCQKKTELIDGLE